MGGLAWALAGLARGAQCVVVRDFEPNGVLNTIQAANVTIAFFVPAMLAAVCSVADVGEWKLSLRRLFYSGAPMSTPSLAKMLETWRKVTKASEPFLDSLTTRSLQKDLPLNGKSVGQSQGSAILRMTHHYWFHIGEIQAIRQMLGHKKLPIYVGNLEAKAPYTPE